MDTASFFLRNVGLHSRETGDWHTSLAAENFDQSLLQENQPLFFWPSNVMGKLEDEFDVSDEDISSVDLPLDLRQKSPISRCESEEDERKPLIMSEEDGAKAREAVYVEILRKHWNPRTQKAVAVAKAAAAGVSAGTAKQCANCKKDYDRKWRRDSNGRQLCNACGLFIRSNGFDRPLFDSLIRKRVPSEKSKFCCANCHTTRSKKKWLNDHPEGSLVCNQCGIYYRLHGVNRPMVLVSQLAGKFEERGRKKKTGQDNVETSNDALVERSI